MSKEVKVFLKMSNLGGTSFKLNYFKGFERLSEPFKYDLIMTAQSSDVNFESLIGQSATVSVSVGSLTRTYNGIVGHFEQDNTPFTPLGVWTVYRASLYPKFWLLKFSGQCRIFQNQSIVTIITSILDESQITYSNQVTSSGMDPLEFCVQYNETDFNFVSRLMELAGIFYFFQQTESGHTLVLADSVSAYTPCPKASVGKFHDAVVHEQPLLLVNSCFLTQRIVPQSNTLKSYNYLTPQTPLRADASGPSSAGGGTLTTYDEIYGQQGEGDQLVKVKLESEDVPQKMVEGVSTIPFFLPGHTFQLEGHPRSDANVTYVLYETIHEARLVEEGPEHPLYKNHYKGLPEATLFRAPQKTPKPRIYSTQTAVVTGQEGQEIYTEQYGRIKVKFHWDPSPKKDETTSCWIRVATLWAGQTWGTLFTPRVGHEVVVSFIDGDPDKPLVVGSVYNGENKPPYLPSEPTKSTIKSQTSPAKDESIPGYNEFRFEDKKGSEEIYIYAQKDFNMKIQNDHNITIVGGNRAITLEAQEEHEEQRQGQQSNDSLKLMNGDKSLEIVKGDYTILLDKGNISVTCAKGDVKFKVTGDISFECTGNFDVKAGQSITVEAGQSISEKAATSVSIEAGSEFSAKAGASAAIQAGAEFSAKAGASAAIEAGAEFSAKAGATADISGGAAVSIKGATVGVTGALITLNG